MASSMEAIQKILQETVAPGISGSYLKFGT